MASKIREIRPVAERDPDELTLAMHAAVAALVRVVRAANAPAHAALDALVPLATAAKIAGTSIRVVRAAIRKKQIPAFGRQRDRSVCRPDLDAWIESRRVVHAPIEDDDIDRRITRLRAIAGGVSR